MSEGRLSQGEIVRRIVFFPQKILLWIVTGYRLNEDEIDRKVEREILRLTDPETACPVDHVTERVITCKMIQNPDGTTKVVFGDWARKVLEREEKEAVEPAPPLIARGGSCANAADTPTVVRVRLHFTTGAVFP